MTRLWWWKPSSITSKKECRRATPPLVLSAVFVPTAFIPGITGRLYQQFALTIAISVILSAFNALTLSPALSAMLLRPRKPARGPLGWFFGKFNQVFRRTTDRYIGASRFVIHKSARSIALLVVFAILAGFFGARLLKSFLPEEFLIPVTYYVVERLAKRGKSGTPRDG